MDKTFQQNAPKALAMFIHLFIYYHLHVVDVPDKCPNIMMESFFWELQYGGSINKTPAQLLCLYKCPCKCVL